MSKKSETRSHETQIEIDAPIEAVWKALTNARDVERWFAPKMSLDPRAGGEWIADFGPGIEWKTVIEVWEPNRHLRLVETRAAGDQPEPCRLVQDYYLESKGGKVVVRLVHSGFGTSGEWDTEFEGTRGGWAACFVRLKHGLEEHRDDAVSNRGIPWQCPGVGGEEALKMLVAAAPPSFQVVQRARFEVCGLLTDLNGSILTISVQPSPLGSSAFVQLLLYALSDAQAASVENHWRTLLAQHFPVQP
jgi:uncharacterized protein YndB with AHSA1/START domain